MTAVARRHVSAEYHAALVDIDVTFASMGLDSLAVVDFVLDIESSCAVRFPAEMMDLETFRCVRSVADSVARLRAEERD